MKLFILFGFIVILVLASGQKTSYSNICDICSCAKPDGQETKYVNCDCKAKPQVQNLNTTMENMKGLDHIIVFTVRNCESLTFEQNSFKNCHDLTSVTVTHVRHVVYPVGVFAKLDTLTIENVDNLDLAPWAFSGSSMTSISIRHSNLGVLPSRSLFLDKLIKFELSNVTIDLIRNKAIVIMKNQINSFVIDGCMVKEMESNAVVISTNTFRLQNSKLYNISEYAFNISAESSIDVSDSEFADLHSELPVFARKANAINYDNNVFSLFPIKIFTEEHTKGSNVEFTNNKIDRYPIILNSSAEDSYISGNTFNCDCSFIRNVRENHYSRYLQDTNYCKSPCKIAINLRSVTADLNVCPNMDGDVEETFENICSEIMQVTTSAVKTYTEKMSTTRKPLIIKPTKPMKPTTEMARMPKHMNSTIVTQPQSQPVYSSSIKHNLDSLIAGTMVLTLVIFNQMHLYWH